MDELQKVIQVSGAPTTPIEANTSYQELGYEDNTTVEIIDSMKSISKDIISDVEEITKNFNTLKEKYDEFTDFDASINQACINLATSASDIEKKVENVLTVLITIVQNLSVADENLLDDLQSLNNILSGNSEGGSATEVIAASASTASAAAATTATISGSANSESSTTSTVQPDGTTATTTTVKAQTAMAGPETQEIKTITQDQPAPASPQQSTPGGTVSGTLSPGTTATTFAAQPYQLSDDEYRSLCATVYAEAAEGNEYTVSDTMGVTSAILNRVEAGNYGGNSVIDVISAGYNTKSQQFSGYGYNNQKFAAAMNNPGIIPPEMRAAIDRTLAGERNTTGRSFAGNGVHNSFR